MLEYLKQQPMSDKHSFKIQGSMSELLDDPGKSLLIVAIVLLNIINFTVAQSYLPTVRSDAVVLGEATTSDAGDLPDQSSEIYRLSVKSLLGNYLSWRASYLTTLDKEGVSQSEQHDWLIFAENFYNKLLDLHVPKQYKDFHISIVVIASNELDVLRQDTIKPRDFLEASDKWQDILIENKWINE